MPNALKKILAASPADFFQQWGGRYAYSQIADTWKRDLAKRPFTLWRYKELLPLADVSQVVSVNVGGTPLLDCPALREGTGAVQIWIKDERRNPTGSFKDRQAAVALSLCREKGIKEVVIASTGNAALAYAALAAKAKIKLWVFFNHEVSDEKRREVLLYGAKVIVEEGTYDEIKKRANEFARRHSYHFDQGIKEVAARESMKTLAFEIAEQLGEKEGRAFFAPDWYVQSLSGGLGAIGVWLGFRELLEMGLVDKIPQIAGIQVQGCAPLVESFKSNAVCVENVLQPKTAIPALATGCPGDAYHFFSTVMNGGGGTLESVTDEEAFRTLYWMAKNEGISMEPASAVAFAGYLKLLKQKIIKPSETVVINCSGRRAPFPQKTFDDTLPFFERHLNPAVFPKSR